jgi:hypothetical protein
MKRDYGGVIWTDHALQRMDERGIKQGDAWATFNRPHLSKKASTKGAYVYYKTFGDTKIEVVAKKNPSTSSVQGNKWVILSVWSKKVEGGKGRRMDSVLCYIKKLFKT